MSTTAVAEENAVAEDPFDMLDCSPDAEASTKKRVYEFNADNVVFLEKDQIEMEKPDPSKRNFDKEHAKRLAGSIREQGLIELPAATPVGNGKYRVVSGKHRTYACFKILKWDRVPYSVVDDGPDNLVEAIEIASNLFRNSLTEPQARRAIERWREIWLSEHPEKQKTASGKQRQRDGFASEVQTSLGVSKSKANRIATTAANITPEARDILEKAGVSQSNIDQIAAVKEPEAIDAAVKLTASGMNPGEAIRQAKKVRQEKQSASTDKPKSDDKAETKPAKESKKPAELTDDEWLNTHCSIVLNALQFKGAFRRDAILYRRIHEPIVKFRGGVKKALAEAKKPGENGAFYGAITKTVRAEHPMNWLICDGCSGAGHKKDNKSESCTKCVGGGYKLKLADQ